MKVVPDIVIIITATITIVFNLGAADMDRRRWAGCLGSRRSGAIDAEAFNYEYGNGGRFNEQLNS